MGMKHVVVTGGASGLGLGCVAHFHRLGYQVTIADVDLAAAQRAIGHLRERHPAAPSPRAEAVDLAQPASVAALAERMRVLAVEPGVPPDVEFQWSVELQLRRQLHAL